MQCSSGTGEFQLAFPSTSATLTDLFAQLNDSLNGLDDKVDKLRHTWADLLDTQTSSARPLTAAHMKRLEGVKEACSLFTSIVKILDDSDKWSDILMARTLIEAASSVSDVETMLNTVSDAVETARGCIDECNLIAELVKDEDFMDCLDYVENEAVTVKSKMMYLLRDLFHNAIKFREQVGDVYEIAVNVKTSPTLKDGSFDIMPVNLEELYECLSSMELLDEFFEELAANLNDCLLDKLLQCDMQSIHQKSVAVKSTKSYGSLKFAPITTGSRKSARQSTTTPTEDAMYKLELVVIFCKFVSESILRSNSSHVSAFVKIWGVGFQKQVKESILTRFIPKEPQHFDTFNKDLVPKLLAFEKQLVDCYMINDEFISAFIATIKQEYYAKKRTEVIMAVRELIQHDDGNTVEVSHATERGGLHPFSSGKSGKDSSGAAGKDTVGKKGGKGSSFIDDFLKVPSFHITSVTQTIVEMAYQIASSMDNQSEEDTAFAFEACKDIFDLWRCVYATVHHEEIVENAKRSALFFNDCQYICHHLTTFGLMLKDRLPDYYFTVASFVNMIPLYRKLASATFSRHFGEHHDNLLREVSLLLHGDDRMTSVSIERYLEKCSLYLKRLSKSWKNVLAHDVYFRCIGQLVDVTLRPFADTDSTLLQIPISSNDEKDMTTMMYHMKYLLKNYERTTIATVFRVRTGKQTVQEPAYTHVPSFTAFQNTLNSFDTSTPLAIITNST